MSGARRRAACGHHRRVDAAPLVRGPPPVPPHRRSLQRAPAPHEVTISRGEPYETPHRQIPVGHHGGGRPARSVRMRWRGRCLQQQRWIGHQAARSVLVVDLRIRGCRPQRPDRGLQQSRPGRQSRQRSGCRRRGNNAQAVLQTRLQGNNPPDTWQTHPGTAIAQYLDSGILADLSSVYAADGLSKVVPKELITSVSRDGKIYGVSTGAHRGNELWYNKKLTARAAST